MVSDGLLTVLVAEKASKALLGPARLGSTGSLGLQQASSDIFPCSPQVPKGSNRGSSNGQTLLKSFQLLLTRLSQTKTIFRGVEKETLLVDGRK